ncbi:MAG: S8 family serine peptidase [Gemmataceae bacterium]
MRFRTWAGWLAAVVIVTAGIAAPPDNPTLDGAIARLGVDRWHWAGLRGRGVKVAILDTGFRGYRNYLGGSLPADTAARSFRFDGDMEAKDSQHGIYCAEVIHAIAPEAEILLACWQPDSPESFVAAVKWAKRRGAKIISCSVIMPCWGDGEGGGSVHEALRHILGDGHAADDVLAVACAGNVAHRHWYGAFRGGPGSDHHWPNGSIDNNLRAWGDELVSVEICRPTGGGYCLQVVNETGKELGRVVASAEDQHNSLVIRFLPEPNSRYAVRIQHAHGFPGPFHLTVLGASLEQHTIRGSIPFPGDGPEWLTIGAWENDARAPYSCCGPNSLSLKPDLVAPVPFPGLSRAKPFGGTSAAAPQAAGLAALYWSRYPKATVADVRSALCRAAEDLLAPGRDNETGHGLLRMP